MSSWARVGVKCVCVDNTGHSVLSVGMVYTITGVGSFRGAVKEGKFKESMVAISLHGVLNYSSPAGFAIERFRPLITQEDDVAMFREWLVVNKVEEEV